MKTLRALLLVLACLAVAAPAPAAAQESVTAELTAGDPQMEDGEYYHLYELVTRPGQRLELFLESDEFDTWVVLISPSGQHYENDDAEDGDTTNSHLSVSLDEEGEWLVIVTSFMGGETGVYTLTALTATGAELVRVEEPAS